MNATDCVAPVPVQLATTSRQTEAKRLSITDFFMDSDTLHHYTGIETYDKFMLLFNCLGPLVNHLTYHKGMVIIIPPEDQLLVTLMKLWFTWDDCEICRKFEITQHVLTNIFIIYIHFLARQLHDVILD